ncbi:PEP-CTERM sorting domain-containing protein [Methylomonas sp. 2BW1-5-20]|uniref:PEP-CTERM sorting domain-containing protein n=1 Tax=Methylomonas sp. 2BW1-5-20 TaxID=3376686 RepID=UPI00404FAC16
MKNRFITNIAVTLLLICSASVASASVVITQLNSSISMDNGYEIYLATNDNEQGVSFGSGNDWTTTFQDTAYLIAGVDYYLHVRGYDQGVIAGFLGQFSLTGTEHVFSNNSSSLTTNTSDWHGNNTGWGQSYLASLTQLGSNGASPWGSRPNISSAATWIWAGDEHTDSLAYFSTKISAVSAVPVPSAIWLFATSLGLFSLKNRRKRLDN